MIYKIILFLIASIGITWVSRSSLRDPRNHGFYRFFAWEGILVLFLLNMDYWFADPFSPRQILAWVFLIVSLVLIYLGVRMFRSMGKIDAARSDSSLVGIEKTTELVTSGVYRFIRHPFYSSLLFLCWGIFFKNITWAGLALAAMITILLVITVKKEESENLHYFGERYRSYMHETRMFVPYLF